MIDENMFLFESSNTYSSSDKIIELTHRDKHIFNTSLFD